MSEGHLWSPDKPLVELPGGSRVSERKVPTVYANLVPFRHLSGFCVCILTCYRVPLLLRGAYGYH
jgi:hypothetical protein